MSEIKTTRFPDPLEAERDEQIGKLLDGMYTRARENRYCPHCGSLMTHLAVTLFQSEKDRAWHIPLPVCLKCDVAGAGSFSQVA
jgi:hypothetical protein